jgi:hypothetical protein
MASQKNQPEAPAANLALDFAALAKASRPTTAYTRPGNGVAAGPNPFTDLLRVTHESGEWRALPLPAGLSESDLRKVAAQIEARVRSAANALGIGANVSKPIEEDGEWVIKIRGKARSKREPASTGPPDHDVRDEDQPAETTE